MGLQSFRELVDEIYKRSIDALSVLEKYVVKTPVLNNYYLDKKVGYRVYLKLENLQLTGAFKVRGALYKLHKLVESGALRGVVAATSGNHGLGVAYASKVHSVEAVIVMPRTASFIKISSVRELGARVVIHGEYLDDAYSKAIEISREMNYVFIHSFNDLDTVSGQATIAHEILESIKPKYVLVPVGGGGLISGLAVVFKKRNPETRVIGVEPRNSPKMYNYVKHGLSETIVKPSIADAVVVKKPGEIASRIVKELVDDIVIVDEKDIVNAIVFSINKLKQVVEGAGALPLASLVSSIVKIESEPVVGIITGGNIDPLILRELITRSELNSRLFILKGVVEDTPFVLGKLMNILAEHGCNVFGINLDRYRPGLEPGNVFVEIFVEIKQFISINEVIDKLKSMGIVLELEM